MLGRPLLPSLWQWGWPWPSPGGKGGGGGHEAENLHPVLLVPGIAGSILNAKNADGSVERAWVRLLEADAEFRKKLWCKFNPETGKSEPLTPGVTIYVPDDNHGLYAVDTLDPDLRIPCEAVYYYHELIGQLTSWGYVPGKTLMGYGYDFRQSNRLPDHMAGLGARIEELFELNGHRKVDVITHSMGGLLMKSFVALYPEAAGKFVNRWITIATPFQGAPGFILDCLLTGIEFLKGWQRELFVAKWSMHQLVQECPSIYEMLPPASFPWTRPPVLHVWRASQEGLVARGGAGGPASVGNPLSAEPWMEEVPLKDWVGLLNQALHDNKLVLSNGHTVPLPLSPAIVRLAADTRRIWESAQLPPGMRFYNIYGTSYDTPFDVCYGSKAAPLAHLEDILHTDATFGVVDGDGTVPIESSMSDGLSACARIGIPGDHRGILNDARLFRMLKHWLGAGASDELYDPETDCVLVPTAEEVERSMGEGAGSFTAAVQVEAHVAVTTSRPSGGPSGGVAAEAGGPLGAAAGERGSGAGGVAAVVVGIASTSRGPRGGCGEREELVGRGVARGLVAGEVRGMRRGIVAGEVASVGVDVSGGRGGGNKGRVLAAATQVACVQIGRS